MHGMMHLRPEFEGLAPCSTYLFPCLSSLHIKNVSSRGQGLGLIHLLILSNQNSNIFQFKHQFG